MAQRVKLDMVCIDAHYRIEEDGAIWSYRLGRYLCPTLSGKFTGYYYVCLNDAGMTWVSVHKLVASKYLGVCPDGCEISHADGNSWNNHWSNLEYVTHSENISKAFKKHGRPHPLGNRRSPSWDTKRLMAAKKKRVVVSSEGEMWDSLNDCARSLGYTREGLWYSMKRDKPLKLGFKIKFAESAGSR